MNTKFPGSVSVANFNGALLNAATGNHRWRTMLA